MNGKQTLADSEEFQHHSRLLLNLKSLLTRLYSLQMSSYEHEQEAGPGNCSS